jgi:hypothetical protein
VLNAARDTNPSTEAVPKREGQLKRPE